MISHLFLVLRISKVIYSVRNMCMTIIVHFIVFKLFFLYQGYSRLTILISENVYNHDCTFNCLLKMIFLLLRIFKAVYIGIYWSTGLCLTIPYPCVHCLQLIVIIYRLGMYFLFYKGSFLGFVIFIRNIHIYL